MQLRDRREEDRLELHSARHRRRHHTTQSATRLRILQPVAHVSGQAPLSGVVEVVAPADVAEHQHHGALHGQQKVAVVFRRSAVTLRAARRPTATGGRVVHQQDAESALRTARGSDRRLRANKVAALGGEGQRGVLGLHGQLVQRLALHVAS